MKRGGRKSLHFVESILRKTGEPMTVYQIMSQLAVDGVKMEAVTASTTPANTIARDIALEIKDKGELSRFVRVARGLYALRGYQPAQQ